MPQLPGRALAKLRIIAYSDEEFKTLTGGTFMAIYNPTTFSMTKEQTLVPKYVAGKSLGNLEFLYSPNRTLSVDLFIDGTGASPPLGLPIGKAFGLLGNALGGGAGSVAAITGQAAAQAVLSSVAVTKYIDAFFKLMSAPGTITGDEQGFDKTVEGNNKVTHHPNYLKIIWGKGLRFYGQLANASVKYTLFNQLGQPLRATISASFLEAPKGGASRLQSPDLTKQYVVKAGDTIYNLAQKEYGSESFYLQIAQANDLKNYRSLIPGQTLLLPPIAKAES